MGSYSKVAEVGALAAEGMRPAEIARLTGLARGTVHTYLATFRAQGLPAPARGSMSRQPALSPAVWKALAPHAAARVLSVPELARLIIEAVALGGIVDAVLDDRDQP